MSNRFDLSLASARPALLPAQKNIVDVLLRVQAPDPPATMPERPGLNLSIVIDRSGSMEGSPLHEAKRSASFMIDRLTPKDRVSVVAYDDNVQVMAPSQPVDNKNRLKAAIALINTAGSTNLHGGWLRGAEEAAAHVTPETVSRVLVLSDGCANQGIIDTDAIAHQCSALGNEGVSTSTYGLGSSFNEGLMTAMARSGRGNSYYSDHAESLLERFQEELSLLSSLCARDVQLRLTLLPGVRCEMLNLYAATVDGWRLPDLAYDGEAWAALRLTVDAEAVPAIGESLVLCKASVTCRNLEGEEIQIPTSWFSLPVLSQKEYEAAELDDSVIRRVTEAEAAKLQANAASAARERDWTEVDRLLAQVRAMAIHSPWLVELVAHLEALAALRNTDMFSKEAQFSSLNMGSRLRSKREDALGYRESSSPAHLQRRVVQGGSGHYNHPASAQIYQLDSKDGHPVAHVDGKQILIDTGSTFSVGDRIELEIAGQSFLLGTKKKITTRRLSGWIKRPINALLGADVLSNFVVILDLRSERVTFAPHGEKLHNADEVRAQWLLSSPVLEFEFEAKVTKGLFSTDAKICYMPRNAVGKQTPVDHMHDFHPLIGSFETDVYELNLEIAGRSFHARCGVIPEALADLLGGMTGIEWIIGADLLRLGIFSFDLRQHQIAVLWN